MLLTLNECDEVHVRSEELRVTLAVYRKLCSRSIFFMFSPLPLTHSHDLSEPIFLIFLSIISVVYSVCLCTHVSVLSSYLPKSISPTSSKNNLFNLRCDIQLWGRTEGLKTIFPLCRQIASHKFCIPRKADVESLNWIVNSLCDNCRRHLKAKVDWCYYSKKEYVFIRMHQKHTAFIIPFIPHVTNLRGSSPTKARQRRVQWCRTDAMDHRSFQCIHTG